MSVSTPAPRTNRISHHASQAHCISEITNYSARSLHLTKMQHAGDGGTSAVTLAAGCYELSS